MRHPRFMLCSAFIASIATPLELLGVELQRFSPGSAIRSSEINANFSEVESRIQVLDARLGGIETSIGSGNGSTGLSAPLQIFLTNQTLSANAGRRAMNEACKAIDGAASFCSLRRIKNASENLGISFSSGFSGGWVDIFPELGSTDSATLGSCQGWGSISSSPGVGGGATVNEQGQVTGASCAVQQRAVCCK
jgi:hypothetical protein